MNLSTFALAILVGVIRTMPFSFSVTVRGLLPLLTLVSFAGRASSSPDEGTDRADFGRLREEIKRLPETTRVAQFIASDAQRWPDKAILITKEK